MNRLKRIWSLLDDVHYLIHYTFDLDDELVALKKRVRKLEAKKQKITKAKATKAKSVTK